MPGVEICPILKGQNSFEVLNTPEIESQIFQNFHNSGFCTVDCKLPSVY